MVAACNGFRKPDDHSNQLISRNHHAEANLKSGNANVPENHRTPPKTTVESEVSKENHKKEIGLALIYSNDRDNFVSRMCDCCVHSFCIYDGSAKTDVLPTRN